jgi:hypothetical protein
MQPAESLRDSLQLLQRPCGHLPETTSGTERMVDFITKANHCLALADRYRGSLTEQTLRAAAESWLLLAKLEGKAASPPEGVASGGSSAKRFGVHYLAEHLPEARLQGRVRLVHGHGQAEVDEARDPVFADAARHDAAEVGQVRLDVQ